MCVVERNVFFIFLSLLHALSLLHTISLSLSLTLSLYLPRTLFLSITHILYCYTYTLSLLHSLSLSTTHTHKHTHTHTHTHFPSFSCRTSSPLFPLSVGRRKASEVQRLDSVPLRARNFRSLVGWLGLVLSPGKPPHDQIWPCLVGPAASAVVVPPPLTKE